MAHAVDILVVVVLLLHVSAGMRRGLLASLLGVVGVVCAAIAGRLGAGAAGEVLRELGVDPLLAPAVGGVLVFLLVSLLFAIVSLGLAHRRRRRKREDEERGGPSFLSRLAGGAVGAVLGTVFLLVLLWTYDALRGGLPALALPDISTARSAVKTRELVDAGAKRMIEGRVDEPQAAALAASLASPGSTVERVAELLGEPPVVALLGDPVFREDMISGDAERVAANRVLLDALGDPGVSGRLVTMGIAAEPYRPESVAADWAEPLADLGRRMQGLLEDPEVTEALAGLREDGLLEDGNWKVLVADPRARLIAWRALTTETEHPETE